ncbi:hypothetical protein [Paenibacillus sophorae]|uniref:hypothetical protein n=1 Tax=Paenibacillus sophorae TaxID=1333845 RepID=UPI001FEC395E|nr:hypothetical protein [Paenibacillus sophorae]
MDATKIHGTSNMHFFGDVNSDNEVIRGNAFNPLINGVIGFKLHSRASSLDKMGFKGTDPLQPHRTRGASFVAKAIS